MRNSLGHCVAESVGIIVPDLDRILLNTVAENAICWTSRFHLLTSSTAHYPVISVTDLLVTRGEDHLSPRKAVHYVREQQERFDDVGSYGSLGRDASDCMHDSVTSHDSGGARVLQEDGAEVRIIGDAFESFLLPRTRARGRGQSGAYVLPDASV
jgi:hypothetical protein